MEHVEGLRLVLRVYLHLIYLFHINSQASEYPFLPRRIKEALSEKYEGPRGAKIEKKKKKKNSDFKVFN